MTPFAVSSSTIRLTKRIWSTLNGACRRGSRANASVAASRSSPTSERMNSPSPSACSLARSMSACSPGAAGQQHLLQRVEVLGRELRSGGAAERDVVLVLRGGRRGALARKRSEVGARGDAGQVDVGGVAELVVEVGVDGVRVCVLSTNRTRPRMRRRASSSIGRVTSTHHSSPATSSSSCLLLRRPTGIAVLPSRAAAMSWICSRSRSDGDRVALELGELAAAARAGRSAWRPRRRPAAADGSPARWLGDLARRPRG